MSLILLFLTADRFSFSNPGWSRRMLKEPVAGPPVMLPGRSPFLADLDGLERPILDQLDDGFVRLEAEEYLEIIHRQETAHL